MFQSFEIVQYGFYWYSDISSEEKFKLSARKRHGVPGSKANREHPGAYGWQSKSLGRSGIVSEHGDEASRIYGDNTQKWW